MSCIFGVAYFSLLGINYHDIGSQRDRKSNSFPRNVSEVNYFYFCFCLKFNADTHNKIQFRVIPQTPNFRLFFFPVRTGLRTKAFTNILKCHLCERKHSAFLVNWGCRSLMKQVKWFSSSNHRGPSVLSATQHSYFFNRCLILISRRFGFFCTIQST